MAKNQPAAGIGHFIWSIFEKSQNLSRNFDIFLKSHFFYNVNFFMLENVPSLLRLCWVIFTQNIMNIVVLWDEKRIFFRRWCLIFHAFFIFFPSKITVKNFQKKLIFLKKGKNDQKWPFFWPNFFLNVCQLCAYTIFLLENFINIIFRPLRIF